MTFAIFMLNFKLHPMDCDVTLCSVVKMANAHHSVLQNLRLTTTICSSSDDSLATDVGQLSLKPYMHQSQAQPSTLGKNMDSLLHTTWVSYRVR